MVTSPGLSYRPNNWDTTDRNGKAAHTGDTKVGLNEANGAFSPVHSRMVEFDSALFLSSALTDVSAEGSAPQTSNFAGEALCYYLATTTARGRPDTEMPTHL